MTFLVVLCCSTPKNKQKECKRGYRGVNHKEIRITLHVSSSTVHHPEFGFHPKIEPPDDESAMEG